MENIEEKVKAIIENKLGVDYSELTDDADFVNDLGADSLDMVELIMDFEKTFEISIDEHQVENLTTVGKVISYIVHRIDNHSFNENSNQNNYVSQPEIDKKSNNYVCQPDIKLSDYEK